MENEFKFELGVKVTDSISGFTGTITGRAQYMLANTRYGVTPTVRDDKIVTEWFDEARLITVD